MGERPGRGLVLATAEGGEQLALRPAGRRRLLEIGIGADDPDDLGRRAAQALLDQGMIDDFQCICDNSNNPAQRIALGYMQADVQVVYLSVVEYFIVNLQGGQSVTINRINTQPQGVGTFSASPNISLVSAVANNL